MCAANYPVKYHEMFPIALHFLRYAESYSRVAADRMRWDAHDLDLSLTGNALHIFALMKRLVLFWPAISQKIYSITKEGQNSLINNHSKTSFALTTDFFFFFSPIAS